MGKTFYEPNLHVYLLSRGVKKIKATNKKILLNDNAEIVFRIKILICKGILRTDVLPDTLRVNTTLVSIKKTFFFPPSPSFFQIAIFNPMFFGD